MDNAQLLEHIRDGVAILCITLRWSINFAVFAFAYWQVAH